MEVLEGEQKPKGAKSRAKQGQTIPRMPCATPPRLQSRVAKTRAIFAVPAEEKAEILVQRAGACVGNSDLSLAVFKLGLQSCSRGAEFAHLDGNLFQRENPCVGRHGLEVRINGTKLMQPQSLGRATPSTPCVGTKLFLIHRCHIGGAGKHKVGK